MAALCAEIERHARMSAKHGLLPAVRLNGTSDLRWERFPVEYNGQSYPHVFAAFPGITFYDYTKHPARKRNVDAIPNYSLTFSLAESNDFHAFEALGAGINVAAVFDTRKSGDLPTDFYMFGVRFRVIDGDATDLRFLDPQGSVGVIVGLRAKGRAKSDTSGFVRRATT